MQDKKPHEKYCRCGRKMVPGLIAWGTPGYMWEDELVQYCKTCGNMSHVAQQYMIRMYLVKRIPLGATALLSIRSRDDGMAEVTYAIGSGGRGTILTAHPYDRRPPEMGINPNDVLLETWKLLDNAVKQIKELPLAADLDREGAKAQGRAFAEVLSGMMPPFFDTADDIVREALRRYDNRDNPEYETPGLGVESLAVFDKMPMANPKAAKTTGNLIPEGAVASSKQGIELGMFTVKQIADSYKMEPHEVKSQLGLV